MAPLAIQWAAAAFVRCPWIFLVPQCTWGKTDREWRIIIPAGQVREFATLCDYCNTIQDDLLDDLIFSFLRNTHSFSELWFVDARLLLRYHIVQQVHQKLFLWPSIYSLPYWACVVCRKHQHFLPILIRIRLIIVTLPKVLIWWMYTCFMNIYKLSINQRRNDIQVSPDCLIRSINGNATLSISDRAEIFPTWVYCCR